MITDEIFENGRKVENLPKNQDYQPYTSRVNQVVTPEMVRSNY